MAPWISLFCFISLFLNVLFAISARSALLEGGSKVFKKRDYVKYSYYAIEVLDDSLYSPSEVGKLLNITYEGTIGQLVNHHLFSSPKISLTRLNKRGVSSKNVDGDHVIARWNHLRKNRRRFVKRSIDGIISVEKQKLRKLHKRIPLAAPPQIPVPNGGWNAYPQNDEAFAQSFGISDPGFKYQWHLHNTVQRGNDINVTGVWREGITGKGVVVALLDDGLDMDSEDLRDNYFAEGSYDFNDHNPMPRPRLSDDQHGTRCAGEIAAVRNDVCGVGIAWDAKVAGIRILSAEISDIDEAEALNYGYQQNHIYSCSWGPPDDGQSVEAPHGLILKAIHEGINNGRGGKGSLFVFASGNGGANDDNCNFDGYTNSIYTITVGAVDRNGGHPFYSEKCSALLVTTYSSGGGSFIYTTDVGSRTCSDTHGGTSAAAPIAAGIFALVLEIRPDLTWRDMQYLALMSAVPFDLGDDDWAMTAAGRYFSHKFGYGKLDAYKIVKNARTYKNLGPQVSVESDVMTVRKRIPMTEEGIIESIEITQEHLDRANFARLEHITVIINIDHTRRGDIEVDLISPKLVRSKLAAPRRFDSHRAGLSDWTLMTVKHWDESPIGGWTIQVRDRNNPNEWGVFIDWKITFWGEQKNQTSETIFVPSSTIPPQTTIVTPIKIVAPTNVTPITTSNGTPLISQVPDIVNTGVATKKVWTYAASGMAIALIFAALAYLIKKNWGKKTMKDYEFAALSEDDGLIGGEDLIPSSGEKQFLTSREVFAAFGDSDEEFDEKSQPVYDNIYMDAYTDDVPEEFNDEETVIQGESSDSGNSHSSVERQQESVTSQTTDTALAGGNTPP
ncbi:hypothetical protein G9A89_008161 [Geosiphon pyriformis]|nr:hypothetical protein G9A89_008161 [Geosiphon pyriformis]